MHSIAPVAGGTGTIQFDFWNQAGTEVTQTIPMVIGAAAGATTEGNVIQPVQFLPPS